MKLFGFVLGSVLVVSLAGAVGAAPARNNCGCYKDGATCFCDKKAKCGCPGDCEPKGCEEQRDKELQKEIDAETKKAAASGHKTAAGAEESPKAQKEESPAPKASSGHKMTAAQSKQLAKLLDVYLADHPEARGRSIEDVRNDVSGH
jgi:pyruvate/2-oxoglutarate dehydrogenase complex dihydrolipoamide acyltransferase (E2) component